MPSAALVPVLFETVKPEGFWGLASSVAICVVWAGVVIYMIGMNGDERNMLKGIFRKRRAE